MALKIVVVDDQLLFAEGLACLLDASEGVAVAGVCAAPEEALELMERERPDVAVVGHCWTTPIGPQVAGLLEERRPDLPIIVLYPFEGSRPPEQVYGAGIAAFLSKRCSLAQALATIQLVAAGRHLESGTIVVAVGDSEQVAFRLTEREREILGLICDCYRTGEIAERLEISSKTVDSHRKNIIDKLGIRTVAGLTRFGLRNGLARSATDR